MSKKMVALTIINVSMLIFVIFMLYKSEPKYVNNYQKIPEVWDYVVMPGLYEYGKNETADGVVLQTDDSTFTFRYKQGLTRSGLNGGLYNISKKDTRYKVIGRGTFYHKINSYVGFNIMLITTLIIIGFFITFFRMQFLMLWDEFLS